MFADRNSAQAAVDDLRKLGLGSDRLGPAIRAGADRVFERDAGTDVIRDTEIGVAAGAIVGYLAGLTIAAVALIPGGVVGLGGILALGVPHGIAGAVLLSTPLIVASVFFSLAGSTTTRCRDPEVRRGP